MLFGYPIEATAENWVHESLSEMVRTIHARLDAGELVPTWPNIVPAAHRAQLASHTGLRSRIVKYTTAVAGLSAIERQRVLKCLDQQNRIADLVSCASDCERLSDLPGSIRKPAAELFGFAFKLLTIVGVRDRHYQAIYASVRHHVCPFCGCESFDAPGAAREDLDHYLAKNRYPFAAANLRNLVPMGMKCNQRYKLNQDILWNTLGVRRSAFDPYADHSVEVRLYNSIPFGGADGRTPEWQLDFYPDSPECVTWDDVFHVRERIMRDVLDPWYNRWLIEFAYWFKQCTNDPEPGKSALLGAVWTYAEVTARFGFSDHNFLRAPMFRMLHQRCVAGDERVLAFLSDLVTML